MPAVIPAVAAQRTGPDTVDGIAPTEGWQAWWREAVDAKRAGAPWDSAIEAAEPAA